MLLSAGWPGKVCRGDTKNVHSLTWEQEQAVVDRVMRTQMKHLKTIGQVSRRLLERGKCQQADWAFLD